MVRGLLILGSVWVWLNVLGLLVFRLFVVCCLLACRLVLVLKLFGTSVALYLLVGWFLVCGCLLCGLLVALCMVLLVLYAVCWLLL